MNDAIQRIGCTPRYADAVIHHHTAYAVEVPATPTAPIGQQTAEVLQSLENLLQRIGSSKSHILMATIYLTDMGDDAAMNAVWDAWLAPGTAPARACVQVSTLADPGWRIEIALTAAC